MAICIDCIITILFLFLRTSRSLDAMYTMITTIIIFIITVHTHVHTYIHIHTIAKVKYTDIRNFIDAFLYSQPFVKYSNVRRGIISISRCFFRILSFSPKRYNCKVVLVYRDKSLLLIRTPNR